jgi:acylphosphatase
MNPNKKTILFSVFFLFFVFLFIFCLILPTLKEVKKTSKEISQTKLKLEGITKRQEEIEKFKKLYPEIKEDLSRFENSFVNKEIPIDFVEFLEKMAKDLEIQGQISILSSSKDSISFQIKGVGAPENVFKFVEKIENCNYLIQVERIRISKLGEAELKMEEFKGFSKNDLKFEISFSVLTK